MIRLLVGVASALLVVLLVTLVARVDEPTPTVEPAPTPSPDATVTAPEETATVLEAYDEPVPTTLPEAELGPATLLLKEPAPIEGDVADVVRAGFAQYGPDVAEQAVRVAQCESTLRTNARNGGSVGLLQINVPSHLARIARLGFTPAQMSEAAPNVAVAADLYGEQGWRPWACRWAA